MKNFYTVLRKLLFALLLLLCKQTMAQIWSPASPVTVCPGETGTYVLSNIPTNYRFSSGVPPFPSGGRLVNTPTISGGSATFQVQWDDTPNGGKLTVAFEQGATVNRVTTWTPAPTQELVARIRSVAGQPGPTGSAIIPF